MLDMTSDNENVDNHITLVKRHILAKLNQRKISELINLDNQQKEIEALLENTIVNHEGNSCIIIGPRSTGKTTLVETTLNNLRARYPDESIVVKLSGFAQSDDKMALREMTRQLDAVLFKGTIAEYEGLEKKSMSETLESLLTVLSGANDEKNRVAVIIVLDELDRFALYTRQTLLYNVLDVSQTSAIGVAVVGVTARMNTREMLEKRVRSRFSQRIFQIRRPSSLQQFWEICRTNLTVDEAALRGELNFAFAREWNSHIAVGERLSASFHY